MAPPCGAHSRNPRSRESEEATTAIRGSHQPPAAIAARPPGLEAHLVALPAVPSTPPGQGWDELEPVRTNLRDVADLDAIRRDLEAHRDESRARIATLAKRPERGTAQGFGKRIGDGTVEAISRLTEIGVGTSLEAGLERTERALAKLDEGTYGLCDACGKPIAPKRLQAMPDVVLCIECAAAQPRAAAPRRR
jgi:DnaK suppressor protein